MGETLSKAGRDHFTVMEQRKEIERLQAELETERMRLAGCGVAAMANTPDTVAQRIDEGSLYWSASYGDVCGAVDWEMQLREVAHAAWHALDDSGEEPDGSITIQREDYDALSTALACFGDDIHAAPQPEPEKDTAELPCCGSTSGVHLIGCQSDDALAGRIHRPEREEGGVSAVANKWISFGTPTPSETGKTKVWKLRDARGDQLGQTRWFGRWRRYAFNPAPFTTFEQACLREIADFCEQRSREQRQQWRKRSEREQAT